MNRETKRMLQRQGQLEADGSPSTRRANQATRPRPAAQQKKASLPSRAVEFTREIRSELRQVAWPTRSEAINSSVIVLMVLALVVALIFAFNWAFSHLFLKLFAP